MAELMHSKLKK